jgi:hypothetical protein
MDEQQKEESFLSALLRIERDDLVNAVLFACKLGDDTARDVQFSVLYHALDDDKRALVRSKIDELAQAGA